MVLYNNYYDMCEKFKYVSLAGYTKHHKLSAEILGVVNFFGPTGTSKDYVAYNMLKLARQSGKLQKHQPVVDYFGGSFAMALTITSLSLGHQAHLVVPMTLPEERKNLLESLGAKLHFARQGTSPQDIIKQAEQLSTRLSAYFIDFLNNDDNPEVHRRITGPQILKATDNQFDSIVIGVGSGGTISGTGEYIKAWTNGISVVGVQPYESQVLSGSMPGRHGLDGIGMPIVPGNYNPYIVDEIISVATPTAKTTAVEALYTDGLPLSIGAGGVLAAAKELASKPEYEGKRILVILSGKRNL